MKKIIAVVMAMLCLLSVQIHTCMAAPDITVRLNGTPMTFDVPPFIENDRTLVPMRAVFEAVGATVEWDNDTRTVIAIREKNGQMTSIALQADSATAFVNSKEKKLDMPAKIVDDRTFVPLRFVIESLGEKVDWDQDTYTVDITTK